MKKFKVYLQGAISNSPNPEEEFSKAKHLIETEIEVVRNYVNMYKNDIKLYNLTIQTLDSIVVISPMEINKVFENHKDFVTWEDYMRLDLRYFIDSDCIIDITKAGSNIQSKGVFAEKIVAMTLDIPIYTINEFILKIHNIRRGILELKDTVKVYDILRESGGIQDV